MRRFPACVRSDYTNDRTFDQFTPRASVSYEFTDTFTTYASYSEGFKSGGFDMRGDVVLTPDTVNGYDPGDRASRTKSAQGHPCSTTGCSYNFAAFYADYSDQQITRQQPTVTGSIASFVDNAGASTIQGVELEGAVAVHRPVLAELRRGLDGCGVRRVRDVHQVVTNPAPPPATLTVPVDLSDTAVFQNTPEWNGNLALNYAQPLSGTAGARCSRRCPVRTAIRTTCSSSRTRCIDQNDAYTLVDASIAWTSADDKLPFPAARAQPDGRGIQDRRLLLPGRDCTATSSTASTARRARSA